MAVAAGVETDVRRPATAHRLASAVALFFLAPLVGEYLFGNVSIEAIGMLLIFAPMYGGGALLIREVVRRAHRGWPAIGLLALAYGIIEEGLVTQLLFNPSYSTYGVEVTGPTYIPLLGINVVMTLSVLALHAVWSICVPIAMVEAFHGRRSAEPWLGPVGIAVAGAVFVLGSAFIAHGIVLEEAFVASTIQLLTAGGVSAVLIIAALAYRRRPRERIAAPVPGPWTVGVLSLVATSALMCLNVWTLGRDLTREGPLSGWVSVVLSLALVGTMIARVASWSRRKAWGERHKLALAGGALLTYAWIAFPQTPIVGSAGSIDLVGNVVLFAGAVALLTAAARSLHGDRDDVPASPG